MAIPPLRDSFQNPARGPGSRTATTSSPARARCGCPLAGRVDSRRSVERSKPYTPCPRSSRAGLCFLTPWPWGQKDSSGTLPPCFAIASQELLAPYAGQRLPTTALRLLRLRIASAGRVGGDAACVGRRGTSLRRCACIGSWGHVPSSPDGFVSSIAAPPLPGGGWFHRRPASTPRREPAASMRSAFPGLTMLPAARSASAMMVRVGLYPEPVGKTPPSAQYRLSMS
jgi:hypothetical protein